MKRGTESNPSQTPSPPQRAGVCLLESRDSGWAFYGAFDKGLGYWTMADGSEKKVLKTPNWAVLDDQGRPFSVPRFRASEAPEATLLHYAPFDPEFIDRLERFLLAIPEQVRRLAALFKDRHQWLALEGMAHSEDFIGFLKQEASSSGGIAFVSAGWSLMKAHHLSVTRRKLLVDEMMTSKRTFLLSRWMNRPCDGTFLRSLAKIKDELSAKTIECLGKLMQCPRKRQAVSEADSLDAAQMKLFASLPSQLASPSMLSVMAEASAMGLGRIESIIPPNVLKAPNSTLERVARSFKSICSLDELEDRICKWANRLKTEMIFPPPLLGTGSPLLKPLSDGQALEREGREVKNCVPGYATRCANGETSFYAYFGRERATVQISRLHEDLLYIEEALGYANAHLSRATMIDLFQEVAALPGSQMVVLFCFQVVGLAYYEATSIKSRLRAGLGLHLRSEPTNEFDPNAIEVLTLAGNHKLGYVRRDGLPKQAINQFKKGCADLLAVICTVKEDPELQIEVAVTASLKQKQHSLFHDEEIPIRQAVKRARRGDGRRFDPGSERPWAGGRFEEPWRRPGIGGNGEELARRQRPQALRRRPMEDEMEGQETEIQFGWTATQEGECEFDDDISF